MAKGLLKTHYRANKAVLGSVSRDEDEKEENYPGADTFFDLVRRGAVNEGESLKVLETYIVELRAQTRFVACVCAKG